MSDDVKEKSTGFQHTCPKCGSRRTSMSRELVQYDTEIVRLRYACGHEIVYSVKYDWKNML